MASYPVIIANTAVPLLLKINPSPNALSIDSAKVYSKTQTLAAWVFEHWGEQPRILRMHGKTKPVLGSGARLENTVEGVEAALFALQTAFYLDKRPLNTLLSRFNSSSINPLKILTGDTSNISTLANSYIYYKFDLYAGFFTDFSYEQSAPDMPRHYEYKFEFLITNSMQQNATNKMFGSAIGSLAAGLALSAGSGFIQNNGNVLKGLL